MNNFKLYHATLEKAAVNIDQEGIRLNLKKIDRKIKGFTDLFNHVFRETCHKYLPAKVDHTSIDRNSAIFLSMLPDEFKKSDHPAPYIPKDGKREVIQDVLYECEIEENLPAFDVQIFNDWAENLLKYLESCQSILTYKTLMTKDKTDAEEEMKHLSNIFTFLMTGNITVLEMFNNLDEISGDSKRELFQGFRDVLIKAQQEVHEMTELWIKKYCEKAIEVSELQENYEPENREGIISWVLKEASEVLPKEITQLEILCNVDIARERIKRIL